MWASLPSCSRGPAHESWECVCVCLFVPTFHRFSSVPANAHLVAQPGFMIGNRGLSAAVSLSLLRSISMDLSCQIITVFENITAAWGSTYPVEIGAVLKCYRKQCL